MRSLALLLATGHTAASFGVGTESFGEGSGEEEPEAGEGEDLLGLKERGSEGVCEDAEGGEVLLEFGDPDRKGLCLSVEGGDALFEFGGAAGEPGDFRGEMHSQRGTGAAHLQPGAEGRNRRGKGDERAREYQDDQERLHEMPLR